MTDVLLTIYYQEKNVQLQSILNEQSPKDQVTIVGFGSKVTIPLPNKSDEVKTSTDVKRRQNQKKREYNPRIDHFYTLPFPFVEKERDSLVGKTEHCAINRHSITTESNQITKRLLDEIHVTKDMKKRIL